MDIIPLHLADVTYPPGHPRTGVGPVFAFAIRINDGCILVDTGIGPPHPLIDRLYKPTRHPLKDMLAAHNIATTDVTAIINTHLHFDHCGGNALFPNIPAYVQSDEYAAALEPGYTIPEWLTFERARFETIAGDDEIAPGVRVIATPGHTAGHQSVLIETDEGPILIAGQVAETADEFRAAFAGYDASSSVAKLLELAPTRAYFSHDRTYWEPGTAL